MKRAVKRAVKTSAERVALADGPFLCTFDGHADGHNADGDATDKRKTLFDGHADGHNADGDATDERKTAGASEDIGDLCERNLERRLAVG